MRSLAEIQARWQATQNYSASVADLQRAVRYNGPSSPCLSGCRSVCWKIFLLSQDGARSTWSQALREGREHYNERRSHFLKFIKHPEALTELTIDPLADDPESPWNTVREDENIRAEILQDVQRLPDDANYHEDHIQLMILDILFVYCKLYPERGGYRQGMHELLAPIVHVVEQDAFDRALAPTNEPLDETLLETVDASFVEHDAYVLFSHLMEHAQSFYAVKDVASQSSDAPHASPFPEQTSAIVERSKYIHEVCLQKVDPELADHLTDIEILPQIFLIRWIRLLFSREFPFNQFLVFWDTIFAIDPSLDLIDFICSAMLIRIRWQLLESDYSVCLQLLLKYPLPSHPHGPQTFVDDALYLRDRMNPSGGASLLMKYTGKVPKVFKNPEVDDPTSPHPGGLSSLRRRGLGMRSPLKSPTRFIHQQGGVETLFQGVLEKGEKLGINQAVRDAMGEIRRNMQGLNDVRYSPIPPRDILSEERAAKALAAMESRNKQLASFLDESVTNLKAVSMSDLEDKAKSLELIEIAAAKIQFVQILLQDPSMEVPAMSSSAAEEAQVSDKTGNNTESESPVVPVMKENEPLIAALAEASVSNLTIADDERPQKTAKAHKELNSDVMDASGDDASPKVPHKEAP
ncbi:TBC1 domain family member 5 [Cladobotryum mycophilum]|uniref:TBC1 domain family member 5 n=1 Tax=Cladobotryum mycophilum TaxID=491253 RepID=A0ABR0SDJ2_9HYPO